MSKRELLSTTQSPSSAKQPLMVLLIDDQAIVGEAVRRMLASEPGIRFQFCPDPAQAMQIATRISPDVILLDLVMPKVDGLTLLQSFRANTATRDIPIVVLSAKEEPKVKAAAFALGANDYMVKLPDKVEVIARIRYQAESTERITQEITLKVKEQVKQVLDELQHNLHVLQEVDPIADPPALRDHAWTSLSQDLNLPDGLRSQLQNTYDQMRKARELHQHIKAGAAQAKAHPELDTVGSLLGGVKEVMPMLLKGLSLLLL